MSDISPPSVDPAQASQGTQWDVHALVVAIVLANLYILWGAWEDKGYGALWMAIIVGPITNGVLFVIGVILMAWRQAADKKTPWLGGVAMTTLPVAAIAIDAVVIFSMDLHGC